MAFCQNCGASVDGAFCTNCGRPMAAAAPPPQPVQPAQPAQPPPPVFAAPPAAQAAAGAPAVKKRSPLPFILLGCFGLLVIGAIGIMATGWFVKSKLENAGFDSDLMQKNPALATAKIMAALNPDVEIVSSNDSAGTVTFREKSTGKTVTMNLDQLKEGKLTFQEEGKGEVTMSTEGGSVVVKTPEGTTSWGTSANAPDWLPAYPGAQGQAVMSGTDQSGARGTFTFSSKDSVDQIVTFYEKELPGKGYKVERTMSTRQGAMRMEVLTGTATGRTLRLSVVSNEPNQTAVTAAWEGK